MINHSEQTLYRLDNLNVEQRRISYQMSTKKILENGSDDSNLYAREIYTEDKLKMYEGLRNQISKTTAQNNVSDSTISEVKKLLEKVKTELIKANTATTNDEAKKAIAVTLKGIKENLFDLVNTSVEGEYLFAGSNSSIKPFEMDSNGKVSYKGDSRLRKVAVEEGSYRQRGVNGFDIMMYSTSTATKGQTLEFDSNSRIVDQDRNEWKLNGTATQLVKYDYEGNATTDILAVTSDGNTPPTYSITTPNDNGTKFEAKRNIFDALNDAINALNKVDSAGNPVSNQVAQDGIAKGMTEITDSYNAVNLAHADLGSKNKIFEISLESVSAKYTQFDILLSDISSVDLAKVAAESKALELTYTSLYTTIRRTSELSLTNFLR